jgi:hypothetical protein
VIHDRLLTATVADVLERSRHGFGIGHVAHDELDARGQRRLDGLALRTEEVLQGDDTFAAFDEPTEQGRANVPYAGQQRRHRRAF